MGKAGTEKRINWERISFFILIAFGILLLLLLLWNLFGGTSSQMRKQQGYSELINTKEIAALSVSEFVYNGIAQSIKSNGDIDYNVLYNSTIKVSIDWNKVTHNNDEEQKIITFFFPEFSIEEPVIDDLESISFIPKKNNLLMKDVIALCKEDASSEVRQSEKLISSAEENLKSIIEAWYSPVLPGYTFEYRFGFVEGGVTE